MGMHGGVLIRGPAAAVDIQLPARLAEGIELFCIYIPYTTEGAEMGSDSNIHESGPCDRRVRKILKERLKTSCEQFGSLHWLRAGASGRTPGARIKNRHVIGDAVIHGLFHCRIPGSQLP